MAQTHKISHRVIHVDVKHYAMACVALSCARWPARMLLLCFRSPLLLRRSGQLLRWPKRILTLKIRQPVGRPRTVATAQGLPKNASPSRCAQRRQSVPATIASSSMGECVGLLRSKIGNGSRNVLRSCVCSPQLSIRFMQCWHPDANVRVCSVISTCFMICDLIVNFHVLLAFVFNLKASPIPPTPDRTA